MVGDGPEVADFCRAELQSKIDFWQSEAQNTTGGRTLTYMEPRGSGGPKKGTTVSLLDHAGLETWKPFTCLDSLRDVEPTVRLIIEDFGLDEGGNNEPEEVEAESEEGADQ